MIQDNLMTLELKKSTGRWIDKESNRKYEMRGYKLIRYKTACKKEGIGCPNKRRRPMLTTLMRQIFKNRELSGGEKGGQYLT